MSSARIPSSPWGEAEMARFLSGYFYAPETFLIGAVHVADSAAGRIEAELAADTPLLVAPYQRGSPEYHPRHVSGADLLMLTVSLGSLHAYFFHGCRWEEGWVGFGSRITQADFKSMATPNRPLRLRSRETRLRKGPKRLLIELDFEFTQGEKLVYSSNQLAIFVRN